MYFLGVLYMVGFTVALPALQEHPKLPYPIAVTLRHHEGHTNTPKEDTASFSVQDQNKEVKEGTVKVYPVFIIAPPELPPFDYATIMKQNTLKSRTDDSVPSEVEISMEVINMKPVVKAVEVIEDVTKPIENLKFEDKIQPIEDSKSVDEPKTAEEPKPAEELKPAEGPKYVEGNKIPKNSTFIEKFNYVEEPKAAEEPKSVEEPKTVAESQSVKGSKSTKVEPKDAPEKPLEDIPVVIQFTIPTTTFLSNIISKFSSLASLGFSWPFHIPSFFNGPRTIYPNYNIDDEIYPY